MNRLVVTTWFPLEESKTWRMAVHRLCPLDDWVDVAALALRLIRRAPRTWTYGYGSIPINTMFRGLFTSINPSYFDVNRRGTIGFDTLPHVAITEYPLVGGFRCIFFSVLLLFWLIQVKSIWVWWYQLNVVTIVIYDLIFWFQRISQAFLSISQYQPLGVRSTGNSTGHTWADAGTCLGDCCWLARQEPHQTTGNLQFYKMVTWFLS